MTSVHTLGFDRQKRGIVIVSALLIFLDFADPTYRNAVIPFFQVDIGNKTAIPAAIWTIFVFYLYRWLQFLYQADIRPVWKSFSSDVLSVVGFFKMRLWMEHASDVPQRSDNWIMNFGGVLHPVFYLHSDVVNDELVVHVAGGNIENQKNISGQYRLPWHIYLIAVLKTSAQNVFMRPMFLEEFFPGLLALAAIGFWIK